MIKIGDILVYDYGKLKQIKFDDDDKEIWVVINIVDVVNFGRAVEIQIISSAKNKHGNSRLYVHKEDINQSKYNNVWDYWHKLQL